MLIIVFTVHLVIVLVVRLCILLILFFSLSLAHSCYNLLIQVTVIATDAAQLLDWK